MKMKLLVVLVFIGIWIATSTARAQPPAVFNFVAPLSGDEEVPPVDTNATGLAHFQLYDENDLDFTLLVANIADVTQAHIHLAPTGENGPVVVFLFGFDSAGVTINGILSEGTITADDLVGQLAGMSLEALLDQMQDGNAYVNVHTITHTGGEIRGQIRAAGPRAR